MSTIGTSIQVVNQDTGLAFSIPFTSRTTNTPGFAVGEISVTTAEETVATEYPTPRNVLIRLLSGDDVKVGTVSTVYPFRLSGANDAMVLRLDVEGLRQIDELTFPADVAGSLGGEYFILDDRSASAVWVWFNTGAGAGTAATGTITYGAPVNTDTVIVNGTTLTKVASAPGANQFTSIAELEVLVEALSGINSSHDGTDVTLTAATVGAAGNGITLALGGGNTGSMTISGAFLTGGIDPCVEPTPSSSRLIEATITVGATAAQVATAVETALNADDEFTATADSAVVTITDKHTGTRTGANANGISGLTVASPNPQDGAASPTVYLKSAGTSQVVVAVAPA